MSKNPCDCKHISMDSIIKTVKTRDPHQTEFLQAVEEVLFSLKPIFKENPKYLKVFEAICEPERVIHFRVPWQDDKGNMCINRGFRVQYNQAIGPYKGGLVSGSSSLNTTSAFKHIEFVLCESVLT